MKERELVYGIIFLILILFIAVAIIRPGSITGAFMTADSVFIKGESLSASCYNAGALGIDFAVNILVPNYGCDEELGKIICEEASRDGILPADVTIEFGCDESEQARFLEACEFEFNRICS